MRAFSRGMSLIELMIALALSAVLVLGLVQVFAASKAAYATAEGLSRVQENSRFALDFIQRDLRMSGHLGCVNDVARFVDGGRQMYNHTLSPAQIASNANPSAAPYAWHLHRSLEGYEFTGTGPGSASDLSGADVPALATGANQWTPSLPAALFARLSGSAIVGSDVVVVRYFGTDAVPVASVNGSTGAISLAATPPTGFLVAGEVYGISDCVRASLFQANTASGTSMTATPTGINVANNPSVPTTIWDGSETYDRGSFVFTAETVVYYVGRGASGQPALMRLRFNRANNAPAQELVEGVDSMQVLFGVDRRPSPALPDGMIDAYLTANEMWAGTAVTGTPALTADQQWRRVGSARISLLLRSDADASAPAATAGTYAVNGVTVTPFPDNRVRHVYDTTIALRNRLFGN